MNLDRHRLAEEYDWRLRNYQESVKRLVTVLVDAIQQEAKYALDREIVYDDDARRGFSFIDQAAHIQHSVLQAVNNADFRGLTQSAGDLHAVAMAMHTLTKLQESLPEGIREQLEAAEDDGLRDRLAERKVRFEALEASRRDDCRASVADGGRGVGFHRCIHPGKREFSVDQQGKLSDAADAVKVKLCTRHANEIEKRGSVMIHRPSAWQQNQDAGYRQRELEAIRRMEARLPREIEAPVEQKELAE